MPTPMPQVNFVTSLGPDDAWITGGPDAGGDNHIIAHYVQGKWVTWNLSGLSVWSLVMQSQTDGWTVATRFPWVNQHDPGPPAVPLHFDGTSWRAVPLPSNVPAQDVQLLSPDDGWAFQHAPKGDPNSPDYAIIGDHIIRAWHLQAGQWQPVAWPLSNIIGVRFWQPVAANEYWALADAYDKTFPLDQHSLGPPPGGPVLIHYVNSHFYVYGEPANWTAPPATASATAGG